MSIGVKYISSDSTLSNISYQQSTDPLFAIISAKRDKILAGNHQTLATIEYQLDLLDQLTQFPLGRFLLEHGSLNGFWTHYVVNHPRNGRRSGLNSEAQPFSRVERFMLEMAPTSLATQERFEIFTTTIQRFIRDGISCASIPCGVMADLLELDYSKISTFSLVGIDIDPESFNHAQNLAQEKRVFDHCKFIQKDAWDLNIYNEFDLITSNGLNIYEPNGKRLISLYQQFFNALKPHGCLITSFLTPPPGLPIQTEWNLDNVNVFDAQLQKLILRDILECKFQIYRTVKESTELLLKAGFTCTEIIYDKAHIFPTIMAFKP